MARAAPAIEPCSAIAASSARRCGPTAAPPARLSWMTALAGSVPVWAAVHALFPPDFYYAAVFYRAALHFFDLAILTQGIGVLAGALAGYGIGVLALRRVRPGYAPLCAAVLVAGALAYY